MPNSVTQSYQKAVIGQLDRPWLEGFVKRTGFRQRVSKGLEQGSQTHLSMWAAVEDNSQSAGRTTMQLFYATLFLLQLKAKIQYMYRQFTHA